MKLILALAFLASAPAYASEEFPEMYEYEMEALSHRVCDEGAEEIFHEGSGRYPIYYVCHRGRWVKKYGDSARKKAPKYPTCREGAEEIFHEGSGRYPIYYVCQRGRWVKKYK